MKKLNELTIKGSPEFKDFIYNLQKEYNITTNINGDSVRRNYHINPEAKNGFGKGSKSFFINYDDDKSTSKHEITFQEFQENYQATFIDEVLTVTGINTSYSII
jgi:predicted RNase H-related nuclease YkuK (DUF458 family)